MAEVSQVAPHVERMINEGDALADKVEKLGAFLSGEICQSLPDDEQALMSAQLGAMTAYFQVLTLRIKRAVATQ